MALITDPDNLNDESSDTGSTEVFIDTSALTIRLATTGNLSTDGVTIKAVYSFLKEEWRNDPFTKNLPAFPFPMIPITDESFELVDGWNWADSTTQELIRTGGWTVRNTSGDVTEQWSGIIGLGSVESNDQLYYNNGNGRVNFSLTGQVNQSVQILSDPNGDGNYVDGFDRRTSFDLFVREQAQTLAKSSIADIGVTSMEPIAYRFPLTTDVDLKIATADTGIDANSDGTADISPYDSMSVTYIDHQNRGTWASATAYVANDVVQGSDGRWYLTSAGGTSAGNSSDLDGGSDTGVTWVPFTGERQIGSSYYSFGVIIEGYSATAEQIYEFTQWSLRQTVDIDAGAGTTVGNIADELLEFVGDTLKTKRQSNNWGVFIDNFQTADTNRIEFVDDEGVSRTFPFVAVLSLNFNTNLVNDASSKYWVYFTNPDSPTVDGDEWGSTGALLVDDNGGSDMTGSVSGATIQHDFDYDGNVQGGRTAGTDASITVVAIGLTTGQYVRATGTISRSTSNVVSLVAPLERNYTNAS